MKNQYTGDIGDYGKYGLLRFLARQGIKIGVNWYLTDDDRSADGKFTTYLENPADRVCDPELFDALKKIVARGRDKSVKMVKDAGLIPGAEYFGGKLKSSKLEVSAREWERRLWFNNAALLLGDAELVFADPDNGISFTKTARNKDSEKFVLPEEICRYYNDGRNVVYYCHKGRRKQEDWEKAKTQIRQYIRDAQILAATFCRGTQRSYIFVIHPDCYQKYELLLQAFLQTEWKRMFRWEPVAGNVAAAELGALADSTHISIEALGVAFSVCKVPDYSGVDISHLFVFTGCTDEEKSLVCPCELVPDNTTHRDDGWVGFRICGELEFSLIGVLAGISKVLAENKVGIFVISTYNTDYVLVKEENYEKAVQALREAGYGVKTQQDLLAGGQTGVAPKKSWLKARWNKICRLMRALEREPYIDDQIEIDEIWNICEEMIASGRLTKEPWELRKSIIQEIVRGDCFDEYGVMDPMEDLLEALCLTREEKLVICEMVLAAEYSVLAEKCALFYKECGMPDKYYGYLESRLGDKQAPYLELIEYYRAVDEEKAAAIAELGMKKCKDSQTELVMFLIQKSIAGGNEEQAARLMQSAKLRRAIDYRKVQEAFPGVRPWTKKEWGRRCSPHCDLTPLR